MLDIKTRLSSLETLGRFMGQYKEESADADLKEINKLFLEDYRTTIKQAGIYNNWFTPENVEHALEQWHRALNAENLHRWIENYTDKINPDKEKTIAIIMAGNIPLVGFHDFISALITGHRALAKTSSDDSQLIPFLAKVLIAIQRDFALQIEFTEGRLKNFDAVIATGSNNSFRYFESYFGKHPHIIRKSRSSVAVLTGDETPEELQLLGEDVFRYFGLGCRNVSKIYMPEDFNIDRVFEAFFPYHDIINNNKYGNNFDYNRAIFLMDQIPFLENGFVIIRENESLHAPGAVIHSQRYSDINALQKELESRQDDLQCIVSKSTRIKNAVGFGQSQAPALWDYADGVDTLDFLCSI